MELWNDKRLRLGAAALAILVLWKTLQPQGSWELVSAARGAQLPTLLQHIFVCVTFAWQPEKIVFLKQIAMRTAAYPTHVDMCVISDQPAKVQALLDSWIMPHVRICGTYNKLNASEKYALVWEHRAAFETAYAEDSHTTFMYMEDDTDVPWPELQSWAADTEVLEPFGFMRQFWRTEISNQTGHPVFLDFRSHCDLDNWNRTLHLSDKQLRKACSVQNPSDTYWRWREPPGCRHRHFIQLPSPYFGMWIATRAQLKRFMKSSYWTKAGALAADIGKADYMLVRGYYGGWPWGYPERSTGMIQFVDRPDGFWSRGVVPYDPDLRQLLPVGRVGHERNGYTAFHPHQVDVLALFLPPGVNPKHLET